MTGIYAMYLRKSQKDMELESYGEMETLAKHERLLTDLALKQGLKVVKVYKEIVSGESIDDRPQMQQLLNDIYQNKYDGVLVAEVERLARGATLDQGKVANAFKYTNTKIITPIKTYDPNNEYDEEYFEFSLFMSRKEFKTITRRMQQGRMLAVKEGQYMAGQPPLGYDIVKKGRLRTLEPNEDADTVKLIFKMYIEERLSPYTIALELNKRGYTRKRGGSVWKKAMIWEVIRNDVYRGKIRWNNRKQVREFEDGKIVKKHRRNHDAELILADGKHPALISDEDFIRAQRIMEQQSVPVNHRFKLSNPLAGLVKCKECGKTFYRNKVKNGRDRFNHRCDAPTKVKSTYFDIVWDAVIESLQNNIKEFEFKMTNDYEMQEALRRKKELKHLEQELADERINRKKIFDFFERKVYTEDEFIERKVLSTQRIDELEEIIERETRNTITVVDYQSKIVKFSEVIEALNDVTVSAEDKNNLLKDIIKRIDYENIDRKIVLDIILH